MSPAHPKTPTTQGIADWESAAALRLLTARNHEERLLCYSEIYDHDNLFWINEHGVSGISGKTARDHALLRTAFPGTGPLLDVGGGTGIAGNAFPASRKYVVCDASRQTLALSKVDETALRPRVFGYATQLPFADQSFEGLLLLDILEHLHTEDIDACLAEAYRVLMPGGRLLVATPNSLSGPWDARRESMDCGDKHGLHLNEMTVHRLAGILARHEFKPLAFRTGPACSPLIKLRPLSLWALSWETLIRFLPWRLRARFCSVTVVVAERPALETAASEEAKN